MQIHSYTLIIYLPRIIKELRTSESKFISLYHSMVVSVFMSSRYPCRKISKFTKYSEYSCV